MTSTADIAATEQGTAALAHAVRMYQVGRLREAEAGCEATLRIEPANFMALQMLGAIAAQTGRAQRAADFFASAVAIEPRHPQALSNLAKALNDLQRHDEALSVCDRAIAIEPGLAGAHHNRSDALYGLDRFAETIESCNRWIALAPGYALAYMVRANALTRVDKSQEALSDYETALSLDPASPDINFNYSLCALRLGLFKQGLPRYEYRGLCGYAPPPRAYPCPIWLGDADIRGKTLFVPSELYRGDLIQFARYMTLIEDAGARPILSAPPYMHRLLKTLGAGCELVSGDERIEAADYYCPLLSLPLAFGTEVATIPARTPYLGAEPALVRRWADAIGPHGFRIGVCWQGSTLPYARALRRSFPLAQLEPIAALPHVRLISLQVGDGADQLACLPAGMRVETLGEAFDSGPDAFIDAAAAMQSLDLVITCDTAIAHLAGALARPTWLALNHLADWRWLSRRDDSPWHPTVRLFRQPAPNDWESVFAAMAQALRAMA